MSAWLIERRACLAPSGVSGVSSSLRSSARSSQQLTAAHQMWVAAAGSYIIRRLRRIEIVAIRRRRSSARGGRHRSHICPISGKSSTVGGGEAREECCKSHLRSQLRLVVSCVCVHRRGAVLSQRIYTNKQLPPPHPTDSQGSHGVSLRTVIPNGSQVFFWPSAGSPNEFLAGGA